MRRYYTRACNFYYGNESKLLVNKKKSIPLNGNKNISFDQIEIISRVSKRKISIKDINSLAKSLKKQIKLDLKKIKSKHKNFSNLNFLKLPNIMGVLNITPDSFSDGGKFNKYNKGLKHALEMFSLGANIIDIGGESTRPGSKAISSKIEWQRIEKIIKSTSKKIPISLDTRKSYVMEKGIEYGVKIINDVSGLNYDAETINVLKKQIKLDLKKIKTKHKNFSNLNFSNLPNIMGVLNLTPDSFSDGGKFNTSKKGLKHALEMFNSGANIIDIGGESTRPGSKTVEDKTEWKRIEKIIKLLSKKISISLDTRKSEIMRKGIKYGVKIINDVSGLNYDSETINILKKYKIPFVIQHSQGTPQNMQNQPKYENELLDIYDFFEKKINYLKKIGIKHNNIIIDPGIGFGKILKHNINLISNISIFHSLGFPILVGNSRKRFIKEIAGKNDSEDRIGGTIASSIYLMMQGVQILRIHDVNELLQSTKVFKGIIKNS
jgi:dihydropteroate synthase